MASTSEEEERRLKAEIAKLSGAIQSHKQQQHYGPAYSPRGRGGHYSALGGSSHRGTYGRGGFQPAANGRGRGRGAAAIPLRNRTLILNDSANRSPAPGSSGTASADTSDDKVSTADAKASVPPSSTTDGWVKRKSTHNMSLVSTSTFQRTEPARLAAMEATRKAKAEAKAASSPASSSKARKPAKTSSVRRGDNMGEVVIDGVVFEFDPSGTKLVKKPIQPSSSTSSDPAQATATSNSGETGVPLKTSINGQDYIRTKRGNLISAELLAKRKAQREAQAKMSRLDKMVGQISAMQATRNASSRGARTLDVKKAKTLCTFFNKTGQCKRGLSCPYLHDSSKLALCPRVLRPGGCKLAKGTCALSHTPRPERVPHCVHYLRKKHCRNAEQCLYTHADLPADAKICRSFSDYGWCDNGRACQERHTYECPDFVERGKCERKACKLVHVIRAAAEVGEEQDVQDAELFVRDDAAAEEEGEGVEEAEEGGERKRKRPLMQTELEPGLSEDEQVDFSHARQGSSKRRRAKAFTQQKDFISFDDEEDEEDEDDEDESDEQQQSTQDEVDDDDVASVHSEDYESSDDEEQARQGEPDTQPAEQDEDDHLVDRDL